MNSSTNAHHFDLALLIVQNLRTGILFNRIPVAVFAIMMTLLFQVAPHTSEAKEKLAKSSTATAKKEPSSPFESEAHKLLNRMLVLQKSFLKKNGRYAAEMFELIPKKKKDKSMDTIPNSHFIVAFSPACVLTSAAARKATRLLLYYPEFPDDKKSMIQLNSQFAKQFETLLKRNIKDLPKGKCPSTTKGFELFAVGMAESSKNASVWSIDQDGTIKKLK